jgi:NAD(P)-dependent dehydrogenase (short-subunit alcohol dehydrogenase family)
MTQSTRPVALVTGSASGIGAAIARRFAAEGFALVVHSRASVEAGRALAAELPEAVYIQADLADEAARRRLVEEGAGHWGRLDVLVNNAGMSRVIPHADLEAATPAIWRALYEVNVIAPWQLVAAAAPIMRATGRAPSIVNIASHAGVRPKGASVPYAVSKAALIHMTKLLALTLAPAIRVNAVAPGLVDTPLTAGWDAARRLWQERSPMRRGARPEEIADIALMLATATYLTGEIIVADGGLNLT